MKVKTAVPKTMATARPEGVRVLSSTMQTSEPAESVVQYFPLAQELATAVAGAQLFEPLVT